MPRPSAKIRASSILAAKVSVLFAGLPTVSYRRIASGTFWGAPNPLAYMWPRSVRDRLEQVNSMQEFDIATLDEMMALLAYANTRYALA